VERSVVVARGEQQDDNDDAEDAKQDMEGRVSQNARSRATSAASESTTSLMMITKVDWKSARLATGSGTIASWTGRTGTAR
jgi:hypothetical protein